MRHIDPKPLGLLVLSVLMLMTTSVRADYPVMSHRLLADPSSLIHNGRLYLYCSNDDDNTRHGYDMQSYVCVSTVDMKNWTDHGEVFRVPRDATWASKAYAPSVIERNGTFYLYFPNGAASIGVATGASPLGPFQDALGRPLVDSTTPGASGQSQWYFDPAAFIDDDGQAYLYFGGNNVGNARVIRLNSDMISVSGSAMPIPAPDFFEGSFMHKRNGIYYFSYVTQPASRIDYSTSTTSPISGFTYRGTILQNDGNINDWNNIHQSVFDFGGRSYVAYHNRYVSNQWTGSTNSKRNIAIEQFNYNADGTIPQVAWTTDGVTQLVLVDAFARQEAEMFNAQGPITQGAGIETQPCSEGGMNVTAVDNGDWIRIRGVNFGAGANGFSARVASAQNGGNIELRLGSTTGTLVGTCPVGVTGGWQTWTTVTCPASNVSGTHDLYLVFTGASGSLLNINWWQFSSGGGTGDTTPPANPTGLVAAAVSSSQINLDWADNTESDLAGYNVYRSTSAGGPYAKVNGALVTSSAFINGSLAASTTYHYVVRAVDTSSNESGNSNEASATTQGGGTATTTHVDAITVTSVNVGQGSKAGQAQVTIRDNLGNPVSGATVTGNFTGSVSESGLSAVTNASGVATLQTTGSAKGNASFTFCVTNVSHASLSYNAGANVETCDSGS